MGISKPQKVPKILDVPVHKEWALYTFVIVKNHLNKTEKPFSLQDDKKEVTIMKKSVKF